LSDAQAAKETNDASSIIIERNGKFEVSDLKDTNNTVDSTSIGLEESVKTEKQLGESVKQSQKERSRVQAVPDDQSTIKKEEIRNK